MPAKLLRVKQVLFVSLILLCSNSFAQVLFTYGKHAVTKQEFMRAFLKNAGEEKPTPEMLREYLDLYAKFKMKVQSAYDLKLDTTQKQREELMSFRDQILPSYLNDDASIELLVDEAMSRNRKEIQLAHIFISMGNPTAAGDTQKQEKLKAAYSALKLGRSFESVAQQFSDDPSVKANKGTIGYITTFVLPYELENIAYKLQAGKFSEPVKTKLGYHILYKVDERAAVGRMKASHILLGFPPEVTPAGKEEIRKRADSVYRMLVNGASFSDMAARYSNDLSSFADGGLMQEFGVGQYHPAFEKAAYSIEVDSGISRPVETEYGFHIIRRISLVPAETDISNRQQREAVRQRVTQSDRMKVARSMLVGKVSKAIQLKDGIYNPKSLQQYSEQYLKGSQAQLPGDLKASAVLFSAGTMKVLVSDWQKHLQSLRNTSIASSYFKQLFQEFKSEHVLGFYKQNLEQFNPDFQYQLNEFREGNLLFDVMQRKIWDVATSDPLALLKYYNDNKTKYWWEMSADAIIVSAPDEATAETIKAQLKANPSQWRSIAENGNGTILADSARFELGQIPVVDRTNFTEGLITANVKNENDKSVTFSYIIKMYPDREPRVFEDARGFVVNDYQTSLEEKWVNDLEKKYPVKVNQAVFASLLK